MKTYKKTIEEPKLYIAQDGDSDSPRFWDNLGYFITCEKRSSSPDNEEMLISLIQNASEESESVEEHIQNIKDEMPYNGYGNVIAIFPINKYEHGGVVYSLGTKNGFDYSNCGFYIVTDEQIKKYGTKVKSFEAIIKEEIDEYNKWVNGELYQYTLYDDNGEVVDSGGSFYNIEDIKANLPEEWKDEDLTEYIKQ